jgi:hypothetical protein
MTVTPELFANSISIGKVYYFSSNKLNTSEPHYFVCVANPENKESLLFFVCCTSQYEKRKSYIEKTGLPYETLVWINPTTNNGLKKDTYIDCNKVFEYLKEDLKEMYSDSKITHSGSLSDSHLSQILIGLNKSPRIEKYIKDILPTI